MSKQRSSDMKEILYYILLALPFIILEVVFRIICMVAISIGFIVICVLLLPYGLYCKIRDRNENI